MIYQESRIKNRELIEHWGIPELKKYPINDETHVLQAVRFFNKCEAKYKSSLAHNIIRRANELNMDTSNWEVLKPYLNKNKTVKENSVMRKSYFERLFQEEDDIDMNDTSSMDTSTDVSDTMTDTSSSDMNMDMGADNSTASDDSMPTTTDTSMDTGTTDAAVGTDVNSTPAESTTDNTTTTEFYKNFMSTDVDLFLEALENDKETGLNIEDDTNSNNTNNTDNTNDKETGLNIEDDTASNNNDQSNTNNDMNFDFDTNNFNFDFNFDNDNNSQDQTNTNQSNTNDDNEEIDLSNIEDDSQQTDTAVNNVNNSINNIKDNNMNFSSLSTEFNPNESDSNAHNDYNTKDVETLNKLIASENSAIDEYFDAAMESKNELLGHLYADIGKEERFHSEQLLFAKSEITGEKYEPRDPEVRKEYEELLKLGMDEETAMSTAVDKMGIVYRHDVTPDAAEGLNSVIDTMKDDTTMLQQEAMIQDLVDLVYKAKSGRYKDGDLYNIVTRYNSDTGIIQEGVNDTEHLTDKQQEKWTPAFIIAKAFNMLANLIAGIIKKTSETFTKIRIKREDALDYLSKNGIKGLFGDNVGLYWYNPQLKPDQQFQGVRAYVMSLRLVYITYYFIKDDNTKAIARLVGATNTYEKILNQLSTEMNKNHHFDADKLVSRSIKNNSTIRWEKDYASELEYISNNCNFSKSLLNSNKTEAEYVAFCNAVFGIDEKLSGTDVNIASIVSNKDDNGKNKTEYISSNFANQLNLSLALMELVSTSIQNFAASITQHATNMSMDKASNPTLQDTRSHMAYIEKILKQMQNIVSKMTSSIQNDIKVAVDANIELYNAVIKFDNEVSKVADVKSYNKFKKYNEAIADRANKEAAYNNASWFEKTVGKTGREYRKANRRVNRIGNNIDDSFLNT